MEFQPGFWKTGKMIGTYIVLAFILGAIIGGNFFSGSAQRSLTVGLPDGTKIEMKAIAEDLTFDSLYSIIHGQRDFRDALTARLRDDSIFHIKDLLLAYAVNENLCATIPDTPLQEKIRVSEECASQPVAERLRDLAEKRKIPFHYVGVEVRIGTPSGESQPMPGRANACRNSEFRDRLIELTNPNRNITIQVRATGSYKCTGFTNYADIQISAEDARKLFGRPTSKFEEAVAVVLE